MVVKGDARVLLLTAGNLRQGHIYVRAHLDFFPTDCIGPAKSSGKKRTRPIEISLEGSDKVNYTGIGINARTGKPRHHLRGGRWLRSFFEANRAKPGDFVVLTREENRRYRLAISPQAGRTDQQAEEIPPATRERTFAEFFAGTGFSKGFAAQPIDRLRGIHGCSAACQYAPFRV